MMTIRTHTPATTRDRTPGRHVRISMTACAAAIALFVGGSGVARLDGQEGRPSQTATVDFAVVKRDGQPVTDLKLAEVTFRIDNKARVLKSLQYVPTSTAAGPGAGAAADIAPAFASNLVPTVVAPRSIVIIVDDESMQIGQEIRLRSALTSFVRSLPPADPVALVTVPHGGIKVGFTTDRDRLARAISDISPIVPIDSLACQTRTVLSTIESTLGLLTRASDQPVAVALLSASLSGQSRGEQAQRATIGGGGGVSDQAGACKIVADDFVRVGQAVAGARAQFYVIHPDYSPSPVLEGIETLRSQTGAPLFHLTSSGEPGLTRMARETSGYYTATFETEPGELTGKPHPSEIKTTRPDVDVRYKPYTIVGRTTPAPSALATPTMTITTAFDMVRSGRAFRDLPLRATASTSRGANGALGVTSWFEPVDPSVKVMTAAAALFDENGNAQAYWQSEPNQPLASWPMALALSGPAVKPGTYRLRIGAIDSNGRTGLTDEKIMVELRPAGPLQMSGLVLGLSRAGGFVPRLQFSTEASAVAYLELYGTITPDMKVSVVFEVARTTDGPAMLSVNGAGEATNEDGKIGVTGTVPVGALEPGDYVVRAVLTIAGQGSGRVIRTLRKTS